MVMVVVLRIAITVAMIVVYSGRYIAPQQKQWYHNDAAQHYCDFFCYRGRVVVAGIVIVVIIVVEVVVTMVVAVDGNIIMIV